VTSKAETYFIDEDNPRDDLCHALFYITFHNTFHLSSKFFGHFCSTSFDEATHHTHDILPSLWAGIRRIKISQCHILENFLPFVDISFW
jgi:hypothetical protein